MAFSTILRRAAPLAKRAISTQRNYSYVFSTSLKNTHLSQELRPWTFLPTFHFSSVTLNYADRIRIDHRLLDVVNNEVKDAEEYDEEHQVKELPEDFPFEIQDNPGKLTLSLSREYYGETIQLEVQMPEDADEDDASDEDPGNKSGLALVASISQGNGRCLEFLCTAYTDEIEIDRLVVKKGDAPEDDLTYEGPAFTDLDENLQESLRKYLEIRGIKPSVTNFLHEYMISKDSREYLMWLKNVKQFISDGVAQSQ